MRSVERHVDKQFALADINWILGMECDAYVRELSFDGGQIAAAMEAVNAQHCAEYA